MIDRLHYAKENADFVTGYKTGGFISIDATPNYSGVQSQTCHGRMKGHIEFHSNGGERSGAEEGLSPGSMEKACVACHTPRRDSDFDFERDRKWVH